jgi:UPF0755 protein
MPSVAPKLLPTTKLSIKVLCATKEALLIPESSSTPFDLPASKSPEPAPAEPTPEPAKPRRSRWPLIIGLLLLLIAGAVSGGIWYRKEQIRKWKWEAIVMPERTARVPERWDVQELSERLTKSRKVRDRETFLEAAQQTGLTEVAPGGYILPAKAGPLELATIFKAPPSLTKVTFPEGWTCQRIADRLTARGFINAGGLKIIAYPPGTVVSPTEGRWFPDTYLLPIRGTAPQLAARMNERFREVMASLPRPFPIGANGKRMTENEIIILASIIERETSVPEERPIVAGVLYNRLRDGMRLQCDATVQYARERAKAIGQLKEGHKSRLLYSDIRAVEDSPYNTYKIKGLPPGPICNPGEAALYAAARPRASKYFYYVMSPAQGQHRFAEDYQTHLRNVRLYRQELKQ